MARCPTAAAEPDTPASKPAPESPHGRRLLALRPASSPAPTATRNSRDQLTLPQGLIGSSPASPTAPTPRSPRPTREPKAAAPRSRRPRPARPRSEVGTVNVGAGAGPTPFYVTGHAYLAGPYKGAPLSLAIVTPAVAGPFDLGTVVVRDRALRRPR